jgi:hypothetical protein
MKSGGQTWKTFIDNHARDIIAVDMFTIPTLTFRKKVPGT